MANVNRRESQRLRYVHNRGGSNHSLNKFVIAEQFRGLPAKPNFPCSATYTDSDSATQSVMGDGHNGGPESIADGKIAVNLRGFPNQRHHRLIK